MGFLRYVLMLCMLCVWGMAQEAAMATDEEGENAVKIAYLKAKYPESEKNLFIGQSYEVGYILTLLDGASFVEASFVDFSAKNKVEILNKNAKWKSDNKGNLSVTYSYKLKAKNATIPPVRVIVQSKEGDYTQEVIAQGTKLQAIELSSNPNYAHVIANSLEVVDYRVKEYDEAHNIVIFQLEAHGGDLSAMKIGEYPTQGLEKGKMLDGVGYGIYYVVLDKNMKMLTFDYFSLQDNRFASISLPLNSISKNTQENGDIKPRNTILMFKNLLIGGLIVLTLLVCFAFKKLRKIALVALALLVLVLIYNIFFNATSGMAKAGANISLIPTHNSTIIEVLQSPTQVDIIGEYEGYYKIVLDSKIGWIRKEYVGKN